METPAPAIERQASSPAIPIYAWLLAALVLGGGAAFFFRRNRDRHAFADGADEFVAPPAQPVSPPRSEAPVETPAASPAPAAKVAPAPVGIVSTRLRPWLEIGLHPVRSVIDDQRATIDFELELFNSGSAPARNIIVAATAFNAGPDQDAQIGAYFGRPNGQGHAVDMVSPLERTIVPLQLMMPRDQLQPYELGGQQVFVPLLAATVTYAWSNGDGQTSASYLLGRGTGGDKLGPFRIDAGPKIYRGLGAKLLPIAVRR